MASALTILGGGLQAISAINQGNTAKKAAELNAQSIENQEANVRRVASKKEDEMRSAARQTTGAQLAMGAQSGLAMSGSQSDLLKQSYMNVEADAAEIRTDAAIKSSNMLNQASIYKWQGKQAQQAGYLGALTAGVMTGASLLGNGGGQMTEAPTNSITKSSGVASKSLTKSMKIGKR